ncbi:unnamed protein product [Prorocentrum cordatum]|uniref:Uncharacterized protein n=1 Tax=Prorocentrum cordatum TaxID=2364126 RepID=A0ABN9Y100_9DINO|nr:unnamed protein product [Polarella glacialis]
MSSIVYTTAKKTGLAAAVSVLASDITITYFAVGARRLSTAVRQLTGTVTVKTSFRIKVADVSTAATLSTRIAGASAAIKAQTNSAMAAADWSGESVITVAPTMTDPVVANPSVVVGFSTPAPTPAGSSSAGSAVTCAKHQWFDARRNACESCPDGVEPSSDKIDCERYEETVWGTTELQLTLIGTVGGMFATGLTAMSTWQAVQCVRRHLARGQG